MSEDWGLAGSHPAPGRSAPQGADGAHFSLERHCAEGGRILGRAMPALEVEVNAAGSNSLEDTTGSKGSVFGGSFGSSSSSKDFTFGTSRSHAFQRAQIQVRAVSLTSPSNKTPAALTLAPRNPPATILEDGPEGSQLGRARSGGEAKLKVFSPGSGASPRLGVSPRPKSPRLPGGDDDEDGNEFTFGTSAPIGLPDFSQFSQLLRQAGGGDEQHLQLPPVLESAPMTVQSTAPRMPTPSAPPPLRPASASRLPPHPATAPAMPAVSPRMRPPATELPDFQQLSLPLPAISPPPTGHALPPGWAPDLLPSHASQYPDSSRFPLHALHTFAEDQGPYNHIPASSQDHPGFPVHESSYYSREGDIENARHTATDENGFAEGIEELPMKSAAGCHFSAGRMAAMCCIILLVTGGVMVVVFVLLTQKLS